MLHEALAVSDRVEENVKLVGDGTEMPENFVIMLLVIFKIVAVCEFFKAILIIILEIKHEKEIKDARGCFYFFYIRLM